MELDTSATWFEFTSDHKKTKRSNEISKLSRKHWPTQTEKIAPSLLIKLDLRKLGNFRGAKRSPPLSGSAADKVDASQAIEVLQFRRQLGLILFLLGQIGSRTVMEFVVRGQCLDY